METILNDICLPRTGCESVARELQGASSHAAKIHLFTQPLLRVYVSFNKRAEQSHSVFYAFGDCNRL
jgi:hypothetical protein